MEEKKSKDNPVKTKINNGENTTSEMNQEKERNSIKVDYFRIGETPGGNQDWFTDYWMHLGGCAALAACDLSICLSQNMDLKESCPYEPSSLTKEQYVDFGMTMKPYIRPRMGGVTKLSIFTEGLGKYLEEKGYGTEFVMCPGESSFEEADAFIKNALKKNLPVPFLLLRHRNKALKDLNWHWFMITGYERSNGRSVVSYHTYGEELKVDFYDLWSTGMYRRGGMTALSKIWRSDEYYL